VFCDTQKSKKNCNGFPSATDILQGLNELQTIKGHITVAQGFDVQKSSVTRKI